MRWTVAFAGAFPGVISMSQVPGPVFLKKGDRVSFRVRKGWFKSEVRWGWVANVVQCFDVRITLVWVSDEEGE